MTWVKLDDQFPIHRKVSALSDAAFRLHVEALCWSARNLTDGRIEHDELRSVTRIGRPERYVAELVRWGVWRETDSGWEIHDYLEYQQSRSKVLQTRVQRSEAGKLGGKRSGEARRGTKGTGKTAGHSARGSKTEAKPKHVASRSLEPPAPFLLTKEGTGRAPASQGAARAPSTTAPPVDDTPNPDWRTMPAYGQADPPRETEARRAAREAASRARRPPGPRRDALAELAALAEAVATPDPATEGEPRAH